MALAKGLMKYEGLIKDWNKIDGLSDGNRYELVLVDGYEFDNELTTEHVRTVAQAIELMKSVRNIEVATTPTAVTTKVFGYIRVSTKEQNESRQVIGLGECDKIFIDKLSGKDTNRPEFKSMLEQLRTGDTIRVISLDRLSRNKQDIVDLYSLLEKKGCYIEVVDLPIISTKGKSDIELGLIVPLVVQLLGYMAEQERKNMLSRQAQGIASMKVNSKGKKVSRKGIPTGRPSALDNLTPKQKSLIDTWITSKDYSTQDCITDTGLSRTTLFKIKKELSNEKSSV